MEQTAAPSSTKGLRRGFLTGIQKSRLPFEALTLSAKSCHNAVGNEVDKGCKDKRTSLP